MTTRYVSESATIAKMQAALKPLVDLDDKRKRVAHYIIADIDEADMMRFDRDAMRTEQIRRELCAGAAKEKRA